MSRKGVNTPNRPITLVNDGKTKESMFKKIIETKERIVAAKKDLEYLTKLNGCYERELLRLIRKQPQ